MDGPSELGQLRLKQGRVHHLGDIDHEQPRVLRVAMTGSGGQQRGCQDRMVGQQAAGDLGHQREARPFRAAQWQRRCRLARVRGGITHGIDGPARLERPAGGPSLHQLAEGNGSRSHVEHDRLA